MQHKGIQCTYTLPFHDLPSSLQGAHFLLNSTAAGSLSIAFASLWDNHPAVINVSTTVPSASTSAAARVSNATTRTVWVLVAGSTNPMQASYGGVDRALLGAL